MYIRHIWHRGTSITTPSPLKAKSNPPQQGRVHRPRAIATSPPSLEPSPPIVGIRQRIPSWQSTSTKPNGMELNTAQIEDFTTPVPANQYYENTYAMKKGMKTGTRSVASFWEWTREITEAHPQFGKKT